MADSSYYYNRYKDRKNEVKMFDSQLTALRKALTNIADTMSDEINAINKELEDLKNDLNRSIRHNYLFTARANAITSNKEKGVSSDPVLGVAIKNLENEIIGIEHRRTNAANERDYYYQLYLNKKEEEKKELLSKIF